MACQVGDACWKELLQRHNTAARALLARYRGTEVKTTGDGFLVEFPSALEATECAVEVQRAIAAHNATQPGPRHLHVRIGLHVGDVVHREADMYGDGVNIAARIEPLALGGGICLSATVYAQVRNKLDVGLTKLDSPALKHIEVPIDVYRVVLPWDQPGGSRREEAPSAHGTSLASTPADQKPIAVLPFLNLSADKADEYLSDGMTQELVSVLAKVPGLRVPGASSCFAFKGKTEEGIFGKMGEQLHVRTVLEGSLRKAGSQLRITAQLINVADGFQLWSETYDRDLTNILAIQSDIAACVATALKGPLGVEEARALAKPPTESPEAHRLYLLGRHHSVQFTPAGLTAAARYFEEALRLDPNYALAYCGLADTYGYMGMMLMSGREAWVRGKELAQKALDLDPDLAEAHLALGMALLSTSDWQGAERETKRALELNPNLALAYDLRARILAACGRLDEAIRESRKALELDPLAMILNGDLAAVLCHARRYDEAVAQLRSTLDLCPGSEPLVQHFRGWCLFWQGDLAGAVSEFEKSAAATPRGRPADWAVAALGYAYARSGERAKAEQIVRDLVATAQERHVCPGARAVLHLGLGETDKALDWLEKSCAEQDMVCQLLKVYRVFDDLCDEPRFQAVLRQVGLDG